MSLSFVPLQPVRVIDPVTNVQSVSKYAVLQGGSKISYKAYTSTSISDSSIQFSCPPASGQVIVDRAVQCTIPIRLTMTGVMRTTDNAYQPLSTLLNVGKDAPRAWPISGALSTLKVGINNDSVSIDMSDIIHPLTKYAIDPSLRSREYSPSPNYPDQSFNYRDLFGSTRNPLGGYGDVPQGSAIPRGGVSFIIVRNDAVVPTTGGVAATAIVDMLISESLFLSPFFFGKDRLNTQGFYNVNSMDFDLTFLAQAGMRMWSHNPLVATSGIINVTSTISTIGVQFNAFSSPVFSYPNTQPQMLFKYITPSNLDRQALAPTIPITYPYFDVTRFPTDIGTISFASGINIVQSNNIQLNGIPRRMYVFARLANSVLQSSPNYTDTYLAISSVNIQFANQNTVLSSATQQNLYMMNVKNHSEQSFQEWSGQKVQNSAFLNTTGALPYGTTGGPLCLEFGTDIQCDSDECAGISGQYQIQVNVGVSNMNATGDWDALAMTLYLVFVSEGTFTITGTGSAQHQLNVISKNDVLDSQRISGVNYRAIQSVNGGDFWSSLGNVASKVNDWLKETKAISTVSGWVPHPIGQAISQGAKTLGYGHGGVAVAGSQGGMRMTKAQLKKRL